MARFSRGEPHCVSLDAFDLAAVAGDVLQVANHAATAGDEHLVRDVDRLIGLSLGRLAEVTGMSKSGVFGLFGSKEELQLATFEKARRVFTTEVVGSAQAAPPGRARLLALCIGYLDHVENRVFPGGCFFASVASEVSSRPGPVRDRVAAEQMQWANLLLEDAGQAIRARELPPDTDPEQLTLELSTMLTGADIAYLLHDDPAILQGIRNTIRTRLQP